MKNHQLRAFLALAEGGSLVKAAARLNKTTAAVSKTIRELEERFEVSLFQRTPHGMPLTAAGRILLPRAQSILAEMVRADEELRTHRGLHQERLRVGLTPAVSVLLGPKVIERFVGQLPDIRLEVFEYQREQMSHRLDDGSLDVALCAIPSFMNRSADPVGELLFSTEFSLAVHSDGDLAGARSLADLQEALWVYTDPSGAQESFIANAFIEADLQPPLRALLCTASGLGVALALNTSAVVLVARPIAEANARVTVLPLLPDTPTLSVYSLVRPSESSSSLVDAFLQIVHASVGGR
ncbi:LysR family transcriptional regulator [Paraburkholderia sp. MMS20-SJTR3]|uniref:LysR family transcriptional regulator n=1 Tax=Paraburkholderia sejongensis TaxID=2886946 RepID=A0ABS8K0V8_9BURK|nr:LysR family transcriptional regulator [Paraburkholderia sp. MMS20-SJTR3]MCC8395718.1 LysR family transcriptional regulator [Paraburkholderia sp. MMS20-SJTR3]